MSGTVTTSTRSTSTVAIMPTVADAIENTLEWLDAHGCTSKQDERRVTRRSRYRVLARITYTPAGSDRTRTFEVATRNLSRTGLSFVHKTLIYPRQMVEVQLPLPDHSISQITAQVVRVRSAGTDLYEIGVEFREIEVTLA